MAHGNEVNNRRYYWLKLDRNFFNNVRILKLRKLAGGDTYTIIYLKLMLLSIDNEGILVYEGVEDTFEEELALKIHEDVENVQVTVNYLKSQDLIEESNDDYFLPQAKNSTGSETHNNFLKRNKKSINGLENFQPISNQIPIEIEKERDIELDKKEINNKEKSNELFNQFWNSYPKKIAKDKCIKWFNNPKNKVTEELVDTMVKAIEKFKQTDQWHENNGQFIPYPLTWLNAHRWEDEITLPNKTNGKDYDFCELLKGTVI